MRSGIRKELPAPLSSTDYCKNGMIGRWAWQVELLNDVVRAELEAQPADIRARFLRVVQLIEAVELPNVPEPYVKHLEGRLWEMRLTGKNGIARAVYVTASNQRVVVVRVFSKKTQKTPRREIELAHARAKEVR